MKQTNALKNKIEVQQLNRNPAMNKTKNEKQYIKSKKETKHPKEPKKRTKEKRIQNTPRNQKEPKPQVHPKKGSNVHVQKIVP